MEEYPEELRTPPVALIAVVGCPELHSAISTHLHSLQPPINTLALPDFSNLSLFQHFSIKAPDAHNNPPSPPQPQGILKRDWLLKHRTKLPSVVAAVFHSHHVSGDPTHWLQLCTHLDLLKSVTRPRNIRLLLLVVRSSSTHDISEDQLLALRKRAELDSKYVLTINPTDSSDLSQSLNRIATAFAELANLYYKEEGRRIKTRLEKKNYGFVELNIRYCFKVAVYAEFRRDWFEALRFYEDAYHALREMIGTSTRLPPVQRLVEIKTVAEQLHFKISTLLIHSGKIMEAITWFSQHNASYKKLVGSREAIFLHWEWISRQFLVFAELLEANSTKTSQEISSLVLETLERPHAEWEFYPAYYYQLAAHYLREKRHSLDFALTMSNEVDVNGESIVPSVYVGQFSRLLEQGDKLIMQPLSDDEYIRNALAEGKRFQDSFEIVALLRKSYESYGNLSAQRMCSFCGYQMGREYFTMGNFSNAKEIFSEVAGLYRKEGWATLLWEVLDYLRKCSKKLLLVKNYIEYSLEMASLPVSPEVSDQSFISRDGGSTGFPSALRRETIHREIFELVCGESGLTPTEENRGLKISEESPINLDIDVVSPLRVVLLASVAFHEQVTKLGVSTLITLSFLSQLPLPVEIDQLKIQFNQSECNFTIINSQKISSAAISDTQKDCQVEIVPSLTIASNKWLRLTYDIRAEQSGKLECVSVTAVMGPYFTICCQAESPASIESLSLWKFEDHVESLPTKDPVLAFSGQKAIQVEEADPQVDVLLDASGPAFVGESFIVPVTVVSKADAVHSGELKINLVDVRGGSLFSPRETDISATDSHHVELCSVTGPEIEHESLSGIDRIKKIQQSFGLVSVPFLNVGETWSCKLEIKWHRPKPIMLFVSLGYCPQSNETAQKVHVHKSLQIEGKTAVVINHHFMQPYRQDSLLLSSIKPISNSDQLESLPLNESSLLVVSSRNCTEVPLQLLSMSTEADDDGFGESWYVSNGGKNPIVLAPLMPGDDYKKVFLLTPKGNSSRLSLGTVCLNWRRGTVNEDQSGSVGTEACVLTKHRLPDVHLELPSLVVHLECPPYAVLGEPLTCFVRIHNKTQLLQEMKLSLADSQSFVVSGPHNGSVSVLPKSEYVVSYKLVPIVSGLQQMPRTSVTSLRYSAGFQPSVAAASIFVFPSKPQLEMVDMKENTSTVVAE